MDLPVTAPTPAIPTFVDGQTLTSQNTIDISSSLYNILSFTQSRETTNLPLRTVKPLCVAYAKTAQAIPNAVDTIVQFKTPIANTDNMWNGAVNYFTVVSSGWYRLSLQVHYDNSGTTSIRAARILVNGTSPTANAVASDVRAPTTVNEGTVLFCSTLAHLLQGATIYASTWANAGAINLRTDFSSSFMSAEWIAGYN